MTISRGEGTPQPTQHTHVVSGLDTSGSRPVMAVHPHPWLGGFNLDTPYPLHNRGKVADSLSKVVYPRRLLLSIVRGTPVTIQTTG